MTVGMVSSGGIISPRVADALMVQYSGTGRHIALIFSLQMK
jgi:hypothetical protein